MADFVTVLSYSVVTVCFVMKVPQIYTVIQAGTTMGMNFKSLLLEFWCFNILMAYPTANGYPLSGYFEFLLLVIQDLVLILLVLRDLKMLNLLNLSLLVLFLSFIASMSANQLPQFVLITFMSTCTPVAASSKLLQLYTIVSNKSAGTVSAGTWGMAVYTSTVRVYTHLMTTGDVMMTVTSTQAALLNSAIFISVLIYGTTGKTSTTISEGQRTKEGVKYLHKFEKQL